MPAIAEFLLSLGGPDSKAFSIDLSDEVVRGSIVLHNGEILPPAPRPATPPTSAHVPEPSNVSEVVAITPWQKASREVAVITAGMTGMVGLGLLDWISCCLGVAPALHSPLMSVTNAISGMVGVGGLFLTGGGYVPHTVPQILGALSVLLASVNVAGGFIITRRMLDMFKRSLSGLASQATARQGNALGMLGVGVGVMASLLAAGFPSELLVQFALLAGLGGGVGTVIGRRITAVELPQMVAALHSVVGLAAIFMSIASILAHPEELSMLHMVTAYLGVRLQSDGLKICGRQDQRKMNTST
ncbi:hypothetical protein BS47DRAFT_1419254 [Hydnum rufescens UP504]|uniref:proton-translocating NAD(P)(+) transhydrogenase n=1 Tax=Hydnum rufescens UP504 TaxID=1448309 RepID=A0A9P6DND1_9AGAM|nr:hypothetical protein BS47DRAFT_1419254 [Hydnum rufescens UP504]